MAEEIREGGCNCGAVRFTARGRPRFISNCHCLDCRLVGTFDHQEGLVPTVDSFPEERLPWVQLIKDQ